MYGVIVFSSALVTTYNGANHNGTTVTINRNATAIMRLGSDNLSLPSLSSEVVSMLEMKFGKLGTVLMVSHSNTSVRWSLVRVSETSARWCWRNRLRRRSYLNQALRSRWITESPICIPVNWNKKQAVWKEDCKNAIRGHAWTKSMLLKTFMPRSAETTVNMGIVYYWSVWRNIGNASFYKGANRRSLQRNSR